MPRLRQLAEYMVNPDQITRIQISGSHVAVWLADGNNIGVAKGDWLNFAAHEGIDFPDDELPHKVLK